MFVIPGTLRECSFWIVQIRDSLKLNGTYDSVPVAKDDGDLVVVADHMTTVPSSFVEQWWHHIIRMGDRVFISPREKGLSYLGTKQCNEIALVRVLDVSIFFIYILYFQTFLYINFQKNNFTHLFPLQQSWKGTHFVSVIIFIILCTHMFVSFWTLEW